jgi:hypothetical protein
MIKVLVRFHGCLWRIWLGRPRRLSDGARGPDAQGCTQGLRNCTPLLKRGFWIDARMIIGKCQKRSYLTLCH